MKGKALGLSFVGKYGKNQQGLEVLKKKEKASASNLWSGIVKAANIITKGYCVSVENGYSTSFGMRPNR